MSKNLKPSKKSETDWVVSKNDIRDLHNRLEDIDRQLRKIVSCINTGRGNPTFHRKPQRAKIYKTKDGKFGKCDMESLLLLHEALVSNIPEFTEHLFLHNDILDDLYSTDCLTLDELEAIKSQNTSQDMARMLIVKLKGRSMQDIELFLDILEKDQVNNHLVLKVRRSVEKLSTGQKKSVKCLLCVMKSTVNVRDIWDSLLVNKLLSEDLYDLMVDSGNPLQYKIEFWESVLCAIDEAESKQNAIETFIRTLEKRYPHIANAIKDIPIDSFLHCQCTGKRKLRQRRPNSEVSVSDESNTTEAIGSCLLSSMCSESDCDSLTNSSQHLILNVKRTLPLPNSIVSNLHQSFRNSGKLVVENHSEVEMRPRKEALRIRKNRATARNKRKSWLLKIPEESETRTQQNDVALAESGTKQKPEVSSLGDSSIRIPKGIQNKCAPSVSRQEQIQQSFDDTHLKKVIDQNFCHRSAPEKTESPYSRTTEYQVLTYRQNITNSNHCYINVHENQSDINLSFSDDDETNLKETYYTTKL